MYNKLQLQSECASRVDFQHGLSYFNEERVDRFVYKKAEDRDAPETVEISAVIRGIHEDYSANAVLCDTRDQEKGKLVSTFCSCPGSKENNRICKHCIALILTYIEKRDQGELVEEVKDSYRQEVRDIELATDRIFLDILNSENARRRIALKQKGRTDSLRLVPYLTMDDVSMKLEFKAGGEKLYIVKDIREYVKAVSDNKPISYGKNKSFQHDVSFFDEESRAVLNFLLRQEQNRLTYLKSYTAKDQESHRFIVLKKELLDLFFGYMLGRVLYVRNDSARSRHERLQIADTDADAGANELDGAPSENAADGREQPEETQSDQLLREHYSAYEVTEGFPEMSFTVTGIDGKGALVTGSFMPVFLGVQKVILVTQGKIYVADKSLAKGAGAFLEYLSRVACDNIFISDQDLRTFVPVMLQDMKKHFNIFYVDFNEADYMPREAAIKLYVDMPRSDVISCELYACYGEGGSEKRYNVLTDRDYSGSLRNEAAEMEAWEVLKKYFNKYDPRRGSALMVKNDEAIYSFITEQIYELDSLGEVFVSDKLKAVNVKKASRIMAGVSLKGDLLSFTVESEDFTPQQLSELLSKYDRRKKFFRLTDGTFINMEGEGFENLAAVGKMLEMSGLTLSSGTVTIPKFRALFLDSELSDNENVLISRSRDFRALIRNMKTFEDNDYEVPEDLKDTLRNYQKFGFRWLKTLKNNGFGGILADEMGLGKTVQTIAFLKSEYDEGNRSGAIIICPASLVYNWKSEIERFAPDLPCVVVSGKQEERLRILGDLRRSDILITSYELLRRDVDIYSKLHFGYQIIDEAQYIKNSATLSSRAVKQISAGFRLALTGTPIENKLCELWSIFDYLMPGFLHDYRQFKEEYETPIVTFKDREALMNLRKLIRPFVLRRLKSDVLKDLPDKLEETLMAKLTDSQEELYRANLLRIRDSIAGKTNDELAKGTVRILADLMQLRQICCDPSLIFENYDGGAAKVDLCIELVKRAIDGGHKVLLFSQFTSMLSIIEKRLDGEKIMYYSLVGQTPKEKRTGMVEAFNQGDVPVFCISLKAGGTGLNLTSADIVIHFDPWWNVAVQNQATDRAHRIGQRNIVTVYRLIAKDTIEENIMKLQERKKELATELLSGEGIDAEGISREELLEILG
ncbi:MAG: DEAD/DEAH box helicase [Clostridia bacterium]|nr:DEAD/DEAH box helicase [Clostridia bacterium]